jgi:hypothetical protein
MRGRHFPRLCRSCGAPMARQKDTCWSCEAIWDYRSSSRTAQRLTSGGHAARADRGDQPPAPVLIGEARAAARARLEVNRPEDEEGGSLAAEGSRRIGAQIAAVQ